MTLIDANWRWCWCSASDAVTPLEHTIVRQMVIFALKVAAIAAKCTFWCWATLTRVQLHFLQIVPKSQQQRWLVKENLNGLQLGPSGSTLAAFSLGPTQFQVHISTFALDRHSENQLKLQRECDCSKSEMLTEISTIHLKISMLAVEMLVDPRSNVVYKNSFDRSRGFPNLTAGFPASCSWQLCRDKTKRPKFPAFVFFCHYNTRAKQLWTFLIFFFLNQGCFIKVWAGIGQFAK